jgi:hypothetical protein
VIGLGQFLFWAGLTAFVVGVVLLGRIARPSAAVLPELPDLQGQDEEEEVD